MIYLKGLFVKLLITTTIALIVLSLSQDVEATMKIAYKKPIFGKPNTTKERRYKIRPNYYRKSTMSAQASTNTGLSTSASSPVGNTMQQTTISSSTTPTLLHSLAPTDGSIWATTTPLSAPESTEAEAAIFMSKLEKPLTYEDATQSQHLLLDNFGHAATGGESAPPQITTVLNNTFETPQLQHAESEIGDNIEAPSKPQDMSNTESNADIEELFPLPQPELLIAPRRQGARNAHTKTGKGSKQAAAATTTERSRTIPCTCGIFLASQIKRGTNEQPEGAPVITNELDRTYACNAVGQKQCQTKCLETIVQHLPNSANILCATLNRDCRKERAYLFIKNCRNQWYNTNLAAGREYCCRDGQPYACPMI